MATELWYSKDYPLLEFIAERILQGGPIIDDEELADEVDRNLWTDVRHSLDRLHDGGYIKANTDPEGFIHDGQNFRKYTMITVTTQGRRAVGQWPDEGIAEELLRAIESKVNSSSDPDERKKWERTLETLREVGVGALTSVLSAAARSASGL